jgi:hypothetical protein
MVNLYSLTAATTARKQAEARAAKAAYRKWKTRTSQVTVLPPEVAKLIKATVLDSNLILSNFSDLDDSMKFSLYLDLACLRRLQMQYRIAIQRRLTEQAPVSDATLRKILQKFVVVEVQLTLY